MSRLIKPPKWCADAVATDRGWADPKTGELLISLKGLKVKSKKAPVKETSKAQAKAPAKEVTE